MLTICTFGDSILDCAGYNDRGVHPGALLVANDDRLFPDLAGADLAHLGGGRLVHRARDGATVRGLPSQAAGLSVKSPAIALLTIGGNDLLGGLAGGTAADVARFSDKLEEFLRSLPIRPVLIGTVYDPTFGDDARSFLSIPPATARRNLAAVNAALAAAAQRHGQLVDLHAHFLGGDPSWFTRTIEPSLRGASEVRRAFLPHVLAHARAHSMTVG